ncbi:MAG TPA: M3 family oligoendopeptidase [Phycisphaerales bacterium]|nr:M3 family oligoendopeptidase [Phycisphaerales bacterium]
MTATLPPIEIPKVQTCIPPSLDATRWDVVEPYFRELAGRRVDDRPAFEQWLLDRSELEAACSQSRADLYIAMTCDTDSKAIGDAYTAYLEIVAPRLEEISFELDRKFVDLAARIPLPEDRFGVLLRSKKVAVDLFRPENVPIAVELGKLGLEHSKIVGAQTVQYEGQERTLVQMAVYQMRPERAVREETWTLTTRRRLQDRDALDDIYDRMIALRDQTARNAGCPTYVEYAFKEKRRFDYTPHDCSVFADAVERHVVPIMRRADERRRRALAVDTLRPWDLAVDPKGRPGLAPFHGGRDLFEKSVNVMHALDERLGTLLRLMGPDDPSRHAVDPARGFVTDNLDLDARKGKRPGGYMYVRDRSRRPFIFMNSAGVHRDAMTMVHEAGHAFHSMLAGPEWLLDYRESPIEFAEVASMSMEHLTMAHWGGAGAGNGSVSAPRFYHNPEDLRRAQREHLEDSLFILAWIATIDSFQHWIYRRPTHTRAQRDDFWIELDQRFGHAVSWTGFEDARRCLWQRLGHLFSHPFYYIEYGIAQLGALQLWLRAKSEGEKPVIDAYIHALRLGGSKPLPDLFAAAGIRLDFGDATVAAVAHAVERELERLAD